GINTALLLACKKYRDMVAFAGGTFSVPYDFYVKIKGKGHVHHDDLKPLPFLSSTYVDSLVNRTLRLSCLTHHYYSLWIEVIDASIQQEGWTTEDARLYNEHEHPWHQ